LWIGVSASFRTLSARFIPQNPTKEYEPVMIIGGFIQRGRIVT
jgi:hypothetical protein